MNIYLTGSRACTSYGQQMAASIAADLVRLGHHVVTSLAHGIDTHTARAVLAACESQSAPLSIVTANGPAPTRVWPRAQADLLDAARDAGARILSPVANGATPTRAVLRQVVDMCIEQADAIVVIEAGARSTARAAGELAARRGRGVYVVPGPMTAAHSAGTLALAQAGAYPVGSARDVHTHLLQSAPTRPPR